MTDVCIVGTWLGATVGRGGSRFTDVSGHKSSPAPPHCAGADAGGAAAGGAGAERTARRPPLGRDEAARGLELPPPPFPYCCPYPCPYCTLPLLTTAKPLSLSCRLELGLLRGRHRRARGPACAGRGAAAGRRAVDGAAAAARARLCAQRAGAARSSKGRLRTVPHSPRAQLLRASRGRARSTGAARSSLCWQSRSERASRRARAMWRRARGPPHARLGVCPTLPRAPRKCVQHAR